MSTLEQLIVALADKLWKGKRHPSLEAMVVHAVAKATSKDAWDIFIELDACFENIASEAPQRLLQTQRQADGYSSS